MATDRVQIEVVRNLTDMARGDRAWVDDTPQVRGMVDSGNWKVIDREIRSSRRGKDVPDHDQPQ